MKVKIGELAKMTGCQVVTIRYYEKEGLLKRPERTERNYRLYGEEDMARLRFIRHCRQHGMSLTRSAPCWCTATTPRAAASGSTRSSARISKRWSSRYGILSTSGRILNPCTTNATAAGKEAAAS